VDFDLLLAEARDLLAPICGWFREGFDAQDLREARALLEQTSLSERTDDDVLLVGLAFAAFTSRLRRGYKGEKRRPSMPVDRSHVAENSTERQRLRTLVDRLSDEQLSRPLPDGWTVAAVLAHLAFWDQRALVALEQWDKGAPPRRLDPADTDWVNDATKVICLALPPRTAAQLAVATAEAVDKRVEALQDERLVANAAAGNLVNLHRSEHRGEHLGQIERALGL
jgi:DinB superfamily